jgi:hypothetical protein
VKKELAAGDVFEVAHPFVWEKVSLPPDDPEGGYREGMSWRPGVTQGEPDHWGECDMVAHGIGAQILTVVSVHKPGRFPSRVFYTRRWRSPGGKEFGKGALRVKSLNAFTRLVRGYRHDFELIEPEKVAA